ncbi:hypothetical protein BCA33_16785 [Marinobacter sp. AC-23]|nr:argininosuccinate synthase domain-containing protein [Marinobacter sp. AC-23]OHY79314.1 hypothetical protein BCA33_16785 [Marinobacter sp. AC-23]
MSSKLCQAELKDHQVGLFAGGGLFSWVQAHLLHEAGANLHVYTADVGQQDESQLTNFKQDMAQLGIPLHTVDLRDVMASFALQVLRYQASYQGGYWNTTGALRAVLVSQLAPRMVEEGCTVLAHGSVNGGNDFRRFTRYIQKFAPSAIPYAPWEDEEFRSRFRDRKEMVEFLLGQSYKEGLEAKEKLSTDGSLMGVSHEGVQLENETVPWIYAPWALTNLPQNAPSQATNVRIEFREGQLHTINGFLNSPQVLLGLANDIAGKHGVGLTAVFEDRVVALKAEESMKHRA